MIECTHGMPRAGMAWRHVIISTYRAWLPGDKRGWRSRDHRVHNSGDYKRPPPTDEHEGLREYNQNLGGKAVRISAPCRGVIGETILSELWKSEYAVLVVAVSATHAHMLIELPIPTASVRKIIGTCKAKSSLAVRHQLPGRVWAARGKYLPVKNRAHLIEAFKYIRDKQGPGVWVWTDPRIISSTRKR